MSAELQQVQTAIAALESQRALLGALRARLAALTRPAEPAQQLKQVTILFLDVAGSTTLSQHLDPEDIHADLLTSRRQAAGRSTIADLFNECRSVGLG